MKEPDPRPGVYAIADDKAWLDVSGVVDPRIDVETWATRTLTKYPDVTLVVVHDDDTWTFFRNPGPGHDIDVYVSQPKETT